MDDHHRAAHAGDQARRLAGRRPVAPAVEPLLLVVAGRCHGGDERDGRGRRAGLGRQHALRLRAHHRAHGAGLVRAQPDGGRVRARPRRHVHHPRADLGLVERRGRPPEPAAPPLGAGPRRAGRGRPAPDRGEQLGGHLLRLRHRAAAGPHRPDGRPRGGALPPRRRLVRHDAPPQRRHGRPGRLGGQRGEAAGGSRSAHCAGGGASGSGSGCGWSPRW